MCILLLLLSNSPFSNFPFISLVRHYSGGCGFRIASRCKNHTQTNGEKGTERDSGFSTHYTHTLVSANEQLNKHTESNIRHREKKMDDLSVRFKLIWIYTLVIQWLFVLLPLPRLPRFLFYLQNSVDFRYFTDLLHSRLPRYMHIWISRKFLLSCAILPSHSFRWEILFVSCCRTHFVWVICFFPVPQSRFRLFFSAHFFRAAPRRITKT